MTIDLGDSVMSIEIMNLAKSIAADRKNHSLDELCSKYKKQRAQVIMFIYASDKLPPALTWYYINKVVGLKPLVELHKKYGDDIISVISKLYKDKLKHNDKTGIKKPHILRALGVDVDTQNQSLCSVVTLQNNEASSCSSITQETLTDCLSSVRDIREILNNTALYNQDSHNLRLGEHEYRKIINKLSLIEQCLDDGDSSPIQQGDPTDQSTGSYIFENMVDESTPQYPLIDYEDISQDPIDYNQERPC